MKEKGVEIVTEAMAKSAEEQITELKLLMKLKAEKTIEADYVLVTVGRRPNTDELGLEELGVKFADRGLLEVDKQSRTSISNIYAIGDIVPGYHLLTKLAMKLKLLLKQLMVKLLGVDYIGMPAVCFTEPELATVGYSESAS